MAAIGGTGKPAAYLSASLLKRESASLRRDWRRCDWSEQEIYGSAPLPEGWRWIGPRAGSYNPMVTFTETGVTVEFCTVAKSGRCRVTRHKDFYGPGAGYQSEGTEHLEALGPDKRWWASGSATR